MESNGLRVVVEQESRPLKKLLSMYLVYGVRFDALLCSRRSITQRAQSAAINAR
jgi:hypothetical protein